jgi:hypothetical protein
MGTQNQHAPQKQAKAQKEQESKASSLAAVHNTSLDSPRDIKQVHPTYNIDIESHCSAARSL